MSIVNIDEKAHKLEAEIHFKTKDNPKIFVCVLRFLRIIRFIRQRKINI